MAFVQAKCTNCGGVLAVDNSQDAAVCPFCNTPYVVEKAINNYNISNNIQANVVNVYGNDGSLDKEQLLKNAETYMQLERYEEAEKVYEEVTQKYPDDFRGWLGSAIIGIQLFCESISGLESYELYDGYRGSRFKKSYREILGRSKKAFVTCLKLNNSKDIQNAINDTLNKFDLRSLLQNCIGYFSLEDAELFKGSQIEKIAIEDYETVKNFNDSLLCYNARFNIGDDYYCHDSVDFFGKRIKCEISYDEGYKGMWDGTTHVLIDYRLLEIGEQKLQELLSNRKKEKKCKYCGGEFIGVFKKECSKCGKEKDY